MNWIIKYLVLTLVFTSSEVFAEMSKTGEMKAYLKCDTNPVPRGKHEKAHGIYMDGYLYPDLFFLKWMSMARVKKGQIDRYELFIQGLQDDKKREQWKIKASGKRGFSGISGNFDTQLPKGESLRQALLKGLKGTIKGSSCILKVGEKDVIQTVPKAQVAALNDEIATLKAILAKSKETQSNATQQDLPLRDESQQFESDQSSADIVAKLQAEIIELSTSLNKAQQQNQNEEKIELEKLQSEMISKETEFQQLLKARDLVIAAQADQVMETENALERRNAEFAELENRLTSRIQEIESSNDSLVAENTKLIRELDQLTTQVTERDEKLARLAEVFGMAASEQKALRKPSVINIKEKSKDSVSAKVNVPGEASLSETLGSDSTQQQRELNTDAEIVSSTSSSKPSNTEEKAFEELKAFVPRWKRNFKQGVTSEKVFCEQMLGIIEEYSFDEFVRLLELAYDGKNSWRVSNVLIQIYGGSFFQNVMSASLKELGNCSNSDLFEEMWFRKTLRYFDEQKAFHVAERAKFPPDIKKSEYLNTLRLNAKTINRLNSWLEYDKREKTVPEQVLNYTETGSLTGTKDLFWKSKSADLCQLVRYGVKEQLVTKINFKDLNPTAIKIEQKPMNDGITKATTVKEGSKILFVVGSGSMLGIGTEIDFQRLIKGWEKAFEACPGKASAF